MTNVNLNIGGGTCPIKSQWETVTTARYFIAAVGDTIPLRHAVGDTSSLYRHPSTYTFNSVSLNNPFKRAPKIEK